MKGLHRREQLFGFLASLRPWTWRQDSVCAGSASAGDLETSRWVSREAEEGLWFRQRGRDLGGVCLVAFVPPGHQGV